MKSVTIYMAGPPVGVVVSDQDAERLERLVRDGSYGIVELTDLSVESPDEPASRVVIRREAVMALRVTEPSREQIIHAKPEPRPAVNVTHSAGEAVSKSSVHGTFG